MQELTLLTRSPELCFGLSGEIDSRNADDFYEEVMAQYAVLPEDVAFDCAKLEFIDSTTLGTLVKMNKQIKADGHKLVLRRLPFRLRKLFVICALDTVLEIEE